MNARYSRHLGIPIAIFQDAETGESRCINALHVQTFITSPYPDTKGGTFITFDSGDTVTVTDDFDHVFRVMTGLVDG
jgi:hypothetical protein